MPRGPQKKRLKIDGDVEVHLIKLACSSDIPKGYNDWTLRLLADKAIELEYVSSISHESVRQVLKKNETKPWKHEMWVIPPEQDAEFVCQMEAVLDVYKRPYDAAYPVVCLDGSPKQLVSEVRKPIKKSDGSTQYNYEYKREGAAEVYMCFEPLAGQRHITVTQTHTGRLFL